VILRCFHKSVLRCRSKLREQREPAKCKCWQREQRNGAAGLLVKCLPTARSLPAPPQRFRHVPLQGQLSRLYNPSRALESVSLTPMALRCLQRVVATSSATSSTWEPPPHCPRAGSDSRGAACRTQDCKWPFQVAVICEAIFEVD